MNRPHLKAEYLQTQSKLKITETSIHYDGVLVRVRLAEMQTETRYGNTEAEVASTSQRLWKNRAYWHPAFRLQTSRTR